MVGKVVEAVVGKEEAQMVTMEAATVVILVEERVVVMAEEWAVGMVAKRAAEDGGFELDDRAADQLRNLLIKLGDPDYATSSATKQEPAQAGNNTATSDSKPASTASTEQSDSDKDAA